MTLDKPTQYGAFNQRGSKPSVNGLQPLTGSAPLVPQPTLKADDHVPAKDTFERVLAPSAPNQALQRSGSVTFRFENDLLETEEELLSYLQLFIARHYMPGNNDVGAASLKEKLAKIGWQVVSGGYFILIKRSDISVAEDKIIKQTEELRDLFKELFPLAIKAGFLKEQ